MFDALFNWFVSLGNDFYLNFIKESRYMLVLDGLWHTILLSLLAITLGLLLGCITYFARQSKLIVLRKIGDIYVDIIRGTPVVTQLIIIYYVIFATVNIDKFLVAVIAFGLNSGAYVSEIIRAGIQSVDKGQTEAGRSLGLNSKQTMTFIIFPQAIKNILPALANEFIVLVKETAVAGLLGVRDLTKAADVIMSRTFDGYMPRIGIAVTYYLLIKLLTLGLKKFEEYLHRSDNR